MCNARKRNDGVIETRGKMRISIYAYTTQEINSQSKSCASQSPDAEPSPESSSSSFKIFAAFGKQQNNLLC